jgi:hypothetical protein
MFFFLGLSPLGTSATIRPIVQALDDDEYGAINGMIGMGNPSSQRKLAQVPLFSTTNPSTVESQ